MSEMGPALTSPTQFEVTLTEEEEAEDAGSESSQFRSFFLLSPLAIQAQPTSRPETAVPRSVHRSSNHPHHGPEMSHRDTEHPSPQKSTRFRTTLLLGQQSEQSETQHPAWEPRFHPPSLRGIPIQGGHGSPENNYTLWDMDRTSSSIQLRDVHSHPSGQLQHTMSPHSLPEWQFADPHTHSSPYPVQPNTSPHLGGGCPLLPYQADDQTSFIPTMSPSSGSSHRSTIPSPQQNVAVHSSRGYESSMHDGYPMMAPWPEWSTLTDPPLPLPLQNPVSPPGPGMFYHLVSDRHGRSTHPEGFS